HRETLLNMPIERKFNTRRELRLQHFTCRSPWGPSASPNIGPDGSFCKSTNTVTVKSKIVVSPFPRCYPLLETNRAPRPNSQWLPLPSHRATDSDVQGSSRLRWQCYSPWLRDSIWHGLSSRRRRP